jgi:hypothetical protein
VTWIVAACVGAAVVILAASCGSFSGSNADSEPDGAPASDGAPVDATQATGDASSSPDGAPACGVIYVDPNVGLDTASGCAKDRPLRTMSVAIARAKSVAAREVHACAGLFDEAPITLDAPISLRGSYDCGTFERAADAGPLSSLTPTTSLTAPNLAASTLRVTGAAVDATTVIDGFAITASGAGNAAAVYVTQSAAPRLSNLVVHGGAGTAPTGPGSVGISIDTGAAPKISSSRVYGGSGTSTAGDGQSGSVAVLAVQAGAFGIDACIIDGGTGKGSGIGTFGVYVYNPNGPDAGGGGDIVIQRSNISGGAGQGGVNQVGAAAVAVFEDGRVHVVQNALTGGSSGCDGMPCIACGVLASGDPAIEVRANSILGGVEPAVGATVAFGIRITGSGAGYTASITDNMIAVGGSLTANVGVRLDRLASPIITGNTIVGVNTKLTSYGIVMGSSTSMHVQNNLTGNLTYGLDFTASAMGDSCNLTTHTVSNDAFVEDGTAAMTSGCADAVDAQLTTTAQLAASKWTSMVRVATAAECGGDVDCLAPGACASDAACFQTAFATAPVATSAPGAGFTFAAAAPCALTQGGAGGVDAAKDYFETMRPATQPSIGAQQFVGTCTP